ncbi:MAG: hypothetical protein IT290_01885 [Deltaproteobacteria bacterium]|nr:hypothetical protein [Deltaproteobacteria bacterium]
MNRLLSFIRPTFLGVAVVGVNATLPQYSLAADSSVSAPLCELLKTISPQVKSYDPAGARAQLVIAITEKFDEDTDTLTKAWNEIDLATKSQCPKEREELLKIVKTETLKDALQ